jgi:hypothetical protein
MLADRRTVPATFLPFILSGLPERSVQFFLFLSCRAVCAVSIQLNTYYLMICKQQLSLFIDHLINVHRVRLSKNCGHRQAYCSSTRWYMSMENHCGMTLTGENRRTRRKAWPTLYTTNPIRTDQGTNPSLRGERPATKLLSPMNFVLWIVLL